MYISNPCVLQDHVRMLQIISVIPLTREIQK